MSAKAKSKKNLLGLAIVIIALAAVCAVAWLMLAEPDADVTEPTASDTASVPQDTTATRPVQIEQVQEVGIDLGDGMRIIDVGRYTGAYMEDGTDEVVSGVMMIVVANTGESDIQYANISLPVGDQTAQFTLSTLPVGAMVVLLEQNRMAYTDGEYTEATASNVALFQTPMSLCEDRLQIQSLDGVVNVTNISDSDIDGDIFIYYKNSAADIYYGGITYRMRLEGGLKAGEIRQLMASHYSEAGSTIMFVTCGGN